MESSFHPHLLLIPHLRTHVHAVPSAQGSLPCFTPWSLWWKFRLGYTTSSRKPPLITPSPLTFVHKNMFHIQL